MELSGCPNCHGLSDEEVKHRLATGGFPEVERSAADLPELGVWPVVIFAASVAILGSMFWFFYLKV